MSSPFLNEQSRTMLDALFHEQNQRLLAEFHERLEKADRREQLAKICGVHEEKLLDHLVDLELQPEAVAAIAIVPLAVIAWADGAVQEQEREAIIQAARDSGVASDDGRYPVLEHWLSTPPSAELVEGWKLYLAALCKQLDEKEVDELKHDLLNRASSIAAAAGGVLGLGSKVSAKEKAALKMLEAAFG